MDAPVYTEVRGLRFTSSSEMLERALHFHSKDFKYSKAENGAHQYHLFVPSTPSLTIVSYFPEVSALFALNTIITFTSYSQETSRKIAERFERLTELEILTEHEEKKLATVPVKNEENLFRQLVREQVVVN
jgi:hypothetical protein